MAGIDWKWAEMAGNGWKWLEWTKNWAVLALVWQDMIPQT